MGSELGPELGVLLHMLVFQILIYFSNLSSEFIHLHLGLGNYQFTSFNHLPRWKHSAQWDMEYVNLAWRTFSLLCERIHSQEVAWIDLIPRQSHKDSSFPVRAGTEWCGWRVLEAGQAAPAAHWAVMFQQHSGLLEPFWAYCFCLFMYFLFPFTLF